MTPFDPKQVFSSRVDNYIKYRPGYPARMLEDLVRDCGLKPGWQVADIGSGTGQLARLFLDFGCAVTCVEPNVEMRLAGEQILAGHAGLKSLAGSAEATGLADASMELISAGMAFHWFDVPRARIEFRRILAPGGWVALAWNRMLSGPEPFMGAYTGLVLEYSPGWTETLHRDQPESSLDLPGFFGEGFERKAFPIEQSLDWEGLCGRTLSTAHVPQAGEAGHPHLFAHLRELFERYQKNGQVRILYETELYYGHLK